jgi:hypothetical protein
MNGSTSSYRLKHKDLVGIPWRVAFALQEDGWWLRSDIIWAKPNPMPESVTDRPTKSHEYVFLLTKSADYWYDADAIREEPTQVPKAQASDYQYQHRRSDSLLDYGMSDSEGGGLYGKRMTHPAGRNKRTVWTINTQPFRGAHFATFPERLVEPMIRAGCPAQVCRACGKPRERIREHGELVPDNPKDTKGRMGAKYAEFEQVGWDDSFRPRHHYESKTVGWSDCGCHAGFDGGMVLDPFMGSGTVAVVARRLGRHFVGIELNGDYVRMAEERLRPYMGQTVLA